MQGLHNEYDQTPLLYAAEDGHVTVVCLLKEVDIEALNKRGRDGAVLGDQEEALGGDTAAGGKVGRIRRVLTPKGYRNGM